MDEQETSNATFKNIWPHCIFHIGILPPVMNRDHKSSKHDKSKLD